MEEAQVYKCANSDLSIPGTSRCDGTPDCPNHDDEKGCFNPNYRCKSGSISVHFSWMCDDYIDCPDGDDEDPVMCEWMKHRKVERVVNIEQRMRELRAKKKNKVEL